MGIRRRFLAGGREKIGNCSGARIQEPGVGMRTPAATFEDLGYGDASELMQLLEEVSKLLEAYARSILDSGS